MTTCSHLPCSLVTQTHIPHKHRKGSGKHPHPAYPQNLGSANTRLVSGHNYTRSDNYLKCIMKPPASPFKIKSYSFETSLNALLTSMVGYREVAGKTSVGASCLKITMRVMHNFMTYCHPLYSYSPPIS